MAKPVKSLIGKRLNGLRCVKEYMSEHTVNRMVGYEQKEKRIRMVTTECDECGATKEIERSYYLQGIVKCKCARPEKKNMVVSVKKIKDIEDKVMELNINDDEKLEFAKMFKGLKIQAVSSGL